MYSSTLRTTNDDNNNNNNGGDGGGGGDGNDGDDNVNRDANDWHGLTEERITSMATYFAGNNKRMCCVCDRVFDLSLIHI